MGSREPQWRTALVTGASGGIGEALAKRLATEGVEVVLTARRTAMLEALAEEIRARGGRARVVAIDVTRADETVAAIRRVDDEIGGLDLVIANAGVARPQSARTVTWENSADVFATNFTGAVATLTAILPRMVARKRGHLVGVSSVAVYAPTPGGSAYRATKSGLTSFLENLRVELGGSGVTATSVHPGFVLTPGAEVFTVKPPMALRPDQAGDLIVRRLRRAPARIDFPFPVVMMLKLMGALPAFLRDPMIRRMDFGPDAR